MDKKTNISALSHCIHVWDCSFPRNEGKLAEFEALLSEEERIRALRFKFRKDKGRYIITRGILRKLIGEYLNEDPAKLQFRYTSFGKPFLAHSGLHFNVSHSGEMALFGFALNTEIGVDLEKIKEDFDFMEVARNFFSQHEMRALERIPKNQLGRAFYRCWTRKESFIKAEGSGLSFPLDQFTVSVDTDAEALLLKTDWNSSERSKWSLFPLVPDQDYVGATAVKSKSLSLIRYHWDAIGHL